MTKEEKIKEAWNNADGLNKNNWANYWTYDKAKEHGMDQDGWIKVCGYEPGEGTVCDFMRPPQLKGIENNNGWIKIESEDDLPKDYIECYFISIHNNTIRMGFYSKSDNKFFSGEYYEVREVTYYMIIEKPKLPIY